MKSLFIWKKYYTRTLYADVLLRPSMVQSKTGPLEDVVISFLLIQWSLEEKHQKKNKKIKGSKILLPTPTPYARSICGGKSNPSQKLPVQHVQIIFGGIPLKNWVPFHDSQIIPPLTLGHPQFLAQPPDWIATPHAICDVSSLLNEFSYSNKRYVHHPSCSECC